MLSQYMLLFKNKKIVASTCIFIIFQNLNKQAQLLLGLYTNRVVIVKKPYIKEFLWFI